MAAITLWLVDDDRIYRFASSSYIREVDSKVNIISFEESEKALQRLSELDSDHADFPTAIMLDVNMPIMDGWDFLKAYSEQVEENERSQVQIYVVSSSLDENDKRMADDDPNVFEFITKPVMRNDFEKILEKIKSNI